MKISQTMILGLALFVTFQLTAAHHISSCYLGSGTDACGCAAFSVKAGRPIRPGRLVDPHVIHEAHIRKTPKHHGGCGSLHPTHQQKPEGPTVTDLLDPSCGPVAPRFRPIGDLCTTCKTSITEVIPAYPGKPVCNSCAQKALMSEHALSDPEYSRSTYTGFSSGNTDLNPFDDVGMSFDEQESIYNSAAVDAPADPVSISLALGLTKPVTRSIPEAGLNFGPISIPVDGRVHKKSSDIPEEKLSIIDRLPVELKVTHKSVASAEYDDLIARQEAMEQKRMELEAQAGKSQDPGSISYSALGYRPVTSNGNHFVNTDPQVVEDVADVDDTPCGPVGPALPGYQSGNVIIRTESAQQYEDGGNSGEGSYEEPDSNASYSSEDPEPSYKGSGFLARLRASACSQNHNKGCGCGR